MTANVTIELLRKTFSNFGLPSELVSDNGPCFIAKEFKSFLVSNKIKQTLVAPHHPQSNGAGERAVQTFKKLFCKFKKGNISLRIARLLYHYRTTIQATTGKTPSELMFGRTFRTLLDSLKPVVTWSKDSQFNKNKFVFGEAVFARNFGKGPEWIAGTVVGIINPLNYKIKFDCDVDVTCVRHASQIFTRELLSQDKHDVAVFNQKDSLGSNNKTDDILDHYVNPNSNVPLTLSDPVNDSDIDKNKPNNENTETSFVLDDKPLNAPNTNASDKIVHTRSGRRSKPPDKLTY